jgi:hypothetical protein
MNQYDEQAEDFCRRFDTSIDMIYAGLLTPPWAKKGEEHDAYDVIVQTEHHGDLRRETFRFYASMAMTKLREADRDDPKARPSKYDFLTCVTKSEYPTVDEFVADMVGRDAKLTYDEWVEIQKSWQGCHREFRQVERLFNHIPGAMDALQEIQ